MLVVFNFNSGRKGEVVTAARDLRCQLIDILVNVAPTTSDLLQPGEQVNEDCLALPCLLPSTPQLEPTTPIISMIPEQSPTAPQFEPATPAILNIPEQPISPPELETGTPVNSIIPEPAQQALLMSTPIAAMPLETSNTDENLATSLDTSRSLITSEMEQRNATAATPLCNPGPSSVNEIPLKSKRIATEDLLSRQHAVRNKQDRGRKFTSREVARRLNLQKGELTKLAKEVHHGSKNDFIASLAELVTSEKEDHGNNYDWDGTLSPQDVVNLAKKAHNPKARKSIYDIIVEEDAAIHHHFSAMEVLDLQDTTNPTELMRALRRRLPGFFDSERKVNSLKAKFRRECEVVWKPERTHSGWCINPERLRETLLHLYWWLPPSEWWKIYGDGRNFGGKDSVAVTLNVLNNEAMFNGISYHSPSEYWPLYIFYGKDTRLNLELNLGDPSKRNSLNAWVDSMISRGHKIFVSSDSKFSDNLLGGGLDSTSTDSFNMYTYETKDTRSIVGDSTGFRSEVGRTIEREHPESLLPSLPTSWYIPDGNHCFCRLTEHMVFDRCMTCMNLEGQQSMGGQAAKDEALSHFLGNINARGVRNGKFELRYDGKKLEQVTLNVNHAQSISSPANEFTGHQYPEILDNVASKEVQFDLTVQLKESLNWPSLKISEYDLEMKIWEVHWKLHELERLDEDPRQYEDKLNPGSPKGSQDPSDYRFGLTEEEIENYVKLVDLHHALTLLRYGSSKLYPYLMKRVDVFPIMLKDLPFHSLFRGGTEGGERTHYLHQCLYFGHSSRGGGWKSQDPILSLFIWHYRFLRRRIDKGPAAVKEAFELYVKRKFQEDGLDYANEMKLIDSSSMQAQHNLSHQAGTAQCSSDHDDLQTIEQSSTSEILDPLTAQPPTPPHNQPVQDSLPQNRSAKCAPLNETPEEPTQYKRGDKVFINKAGKPARAMVCEVTPQKKHLKVAIEPKEPPIIVEIATLHKAVPQVLNGLTFVISGRLNEKDKSGITNAAQLIPVILSNGGKVFTKDVSGAADAEFILVTSQKELDKEVRKINKPIVHAYRYKWPIISKQFVLDAAKDKVLPNIENYKLQVRNLDSAPASSLAHVKVVKQSDLLVSGKRSAHRELKKTMRQKRKPDSTENESEKENDVPKHRPKRPANGFIVFSQKKYAELAKDNPDKSMTEINKTIGQQWKLLNDEDKMQYKEEGWTNFQQRKEIWNRALTLAQTNHANADTSHSPQLAFTRMN